MTIFHILLIIYAGLTVCAAIVGFSVCIVAGRIETLRKQQIKRQARVSTLENPTTESAAVQAKHWVMDVG